MVRFYECSPYLCNTILYSYLLFIFERLTKTLNMNIMYIGGNDYNYVYWKHSLQANMHNRIFGTFTRIRTSNMRIFTFSIFVPTHIYAVKFLAFHSVKHLFRFICFSTFCGNKQRVISSKSTACGLQHQTMTNSSYTHPP